MHSSARRHRESCTKTALRQKGSVSSGAFLSLLQPQQGVVLARPLHTMCCRMGCALARALGLAFDPRVAAEAWVGARYVERRRGGELRQDGACDIRHCRLTTRPNALPAAPGMMSTGLRRSGLG